MKNERIFIGQNASTQALTDLGRIANDVNQHQVFVVSTIESIISKCEDDKTNAAIKTFKEYKDILKIIYEEINTLMETLHVYFVRHAKEDWEAGSQTAATVGEFYPTGGSGGGGGGGGIGNLPSMAATGGAIGSIGGIGSGKSPNINIGVDNTTNSANTNQLGDGNTASTAQRGHDSAKWTPGTSTVNDKYTTTYGRDGRDGTNAIATGSTVYKPVPKPYAPSSQQTIYKPSGVIPGQTQVQGQDQVVNLSSPAPSSGGYSGGGFSPKGVTPPNTGLDAFDSSMADDQFVPSDDSSIDIGKPLEGTEFTASVAESSDSLPGISGSNSFAKAGMLAAGVGALGAGGIALSNHKKNEDDLEVDYSLNDENALQESDIFVQQGNNNFDNEDYYW